jgi:type IV secretion system protein VirB8
VVAVEKAGIEQAEAIRQSLLFAYVTDRETYDQHDNESRILRAYTWSEGNARQGLVSLWTEGNANYPPKLYGQNSKVVIDVLSITPVTLCRSAWRRCSTAKRSAIMVLPL